MRDFPDVGLYTKDQWKEFKHIYVSEDNNHLNGVCVVIPLNKWIKIGPVIVLKTFQGKGYGKKLLNHVVDEFKYKNIYIGSSNQKVQKIVEELKFQRVPSFNNLPGEIKVYLIKHFFNRINLEFLIDSVPKIFNKSRKYGYYTRESFF